MRLSVSLVAACLLLAACGQKDHADVVVKDKDGSLTISANGQHFTMQASDGSKGQVNINANGQRVTMHAADGSAVVNIDTHGVDTSGKLPAFISIYPGAHVMSLVTGNGQAGTMTLQAKAAPAEIVGFYKQKAEGAGFKQTLSANDAGNLLYGATFAGRTVQVLASKDSDGTHAQVTWSSQ